jgi:hypothetical protein
MISNARMIERRLFHHHFYGDSPEPVLHAVLAYQNRDGGFGHGLEPDSASPESQPLFSLMALEVLDEIDLLPIEVARRAADYFGSLVQVSGGIPWMIRPRSDYPRQPHFDEVDEKPAINPTAPLLAILRKHGVDTPWMDRAEQFCWDAIARSEQIDCAECTLRRLRFLEQEAAASKSGVEIQKIMERLKRPGVVWHDLGQEGIGLFGKPTPLNYAPWPDSLLRSCFTEREISFHLDGLIQRQKEDGRWATPWGTSAGTRLEWDGMQTLWSLRVLVANGRME